MKRTFLRRLRAAYLVGAAGFVAWLVATRWDELSVLLRGTRPGWLLVSLVTSFGLLILSPIIWRTVLDASGSPVPLGDLVHAAARSVLGRYIPGSVWFAVGRVALLSRAGVPAARLTLAATTEMALSIATTIGIGALVLGLNGELPGGVAVSLLASLGIVVVATPPLGGLLLAAIAARRGLAISEISWAGYAASLAAVVAFWAWSALTFAVYLRAFPAADGFHAWVVIGGFLFSWGVGFLAFVAPQGVGVFEVTLASILATDGIATVAVVIGGYRVVMLARDVIAAMLAEVTASQRAAPPSAPMG